MELESVVNVTYRNGEEYIDGTAVVKWEAKCETEGDSAINIFPEIPDQKISIKYEDNSGEESVPVEKEVEIKNVDKSILRTKISSKYLQIHAESLDIDLKKKKTVMEFLA